MKFKHYWNHFMIPRNVISITCIFQHVFLEKFYRKFFLLQHCIWFKTRTWKAVALEQTRQSKLYYLQYLTSARRASLHLYYPLWSNKLASTFSFSLYQNSTYITEVNSSIKLFKFYWLLQIFCVHSYFCSLLIIYLHNY